MTPDMYQTNIKHDQLIECGLLKSQKMIQNIGVVRGGPWKAENGQKQPKYWIGRPQKADGRV